MRSRSVFPGLLLILIGVGLFVYYDMNIMPDREARELIVQGNIISEREDKESINEAINVYSQVLAKYPKSKMVSEAYFQIGRCYELLGLYRLAKLKFVYAVKHNPRDVPDEVKSEVLIHMAKIMAKKSYSDEAINQLYGLLSTNFNSEFRSRVYSELGHVYLNLKQFLNAEKMFEIALQEDGNNEDAIIGKANAFRNRGLYIQAFNLYDYFLRYFGGVSRYTPDVKRKYIEQTYGIGLDLFKKGQYSNAIPYLQRILDKFPSDKYSENARYWIGECYFAMRSFDTAITWFKSVLANSYFHKDQDARMKIGYAYFTMKKFDLAAREFQLYLRYYPSGVYAKTADEWSKMSTKELLYRIQTKKLPEAKKDESKEEEKPPSKEEVKEEDKAEEEDVEEEDDEEDDEEEDEEEDEEGDDSEDEVEDADLEDDEEIFGKKYQEMFGKKLKFENVAEL